MQWALAFEAFCCLLSFVIVFKCGEVCRYTKTALHLGYLQRSVLLIERAMILALGKMNRLPNVLRCAYIGVQRTLSNKL